MTHPADRAVDLHNEYVAACQRFADTFDARNREFLAALADAEAIVAAHGLDSPEAKAARQRVIAAMGAASGTVPGDMADARADLERAEHALRQFTLNTTSQEMPRA